LQAKRLNPSGDGSEFVVDSLQRFIALRLPRKVNDVDVDGKAGHVLYEQIDCSPAFHGEYGIVENRWGHGQQ
jgi:hypothetical protein